ncbi:hypothetical protein J4N42_06180 [Vibrio sp. SCSIO 43135]|uniref:Uncharacterized protein n=1 Tax=Vibrio paucivorans TaxID=2829489 RepID=A0A9X3CF78_9VIBR|nr:MULTISPECIES: hypothetical protein [Vibrio]MCW8334759.1 hypothetical protein [Vibrio paucivorans]USD42305.1 hypothetical protein J4N42_06180 [Vibrio sp. SCSIO 43135]
MNKTLLSVLLGGSVVLAGCGGDSSSSSDSSGSGSSGSSTTAQTGQFIDAAVANINYETETLSGVTDENGNYQYEEGETVTFSIGSVTFPPVLASGVVTPLDIADSNDTEDDQVVNIIRFLQTLDTDGDPSNGITISDDVKTAATEDIDFDVSKTDFESDSEVLAVIAQGGQESTISALIDESDALSHFEGSLNSFDITFGKFVGTWLISGDNENELLLFTFFEDGTYLHAEIDTDLENAENPDEINGMEWGEYEVNDLEEFFSETTYFDENGDTGLTDIITSDLTDSQDGATVVFSFSDDGLTLTFNITEYENDVNVGTDTMTFTKLTSNGIVGTWLIAGENENELLMFTFLDDGTYVHAEVDTDLSTAENPSEDNGLEWGSYELNSQTNEMTISFDSLGTDLNGDTGLSDFADSSDNQLFVTVSGDVMTVRVVEGSDEETLTFYRH